jgi:hypothetical protein
LGPGGLDSFGSVQQLGGDGFKLIFQSAIRYGWYQVEILLHRIDVEGESLLIVSLGLLPSGPTGDDLLRILGIHISRRHPALFTTDERHQKTVLDTVTPPTHLDFLELGS